MNSHLPRAGLSFAAHIAVPGDDQADAAEIAADHRVGNEADQPPDPRQPQADLDQSCQQAGQPQHHQDGAGRNLLLNEAQGQGRQHRRRWSARGGDQPGTAAEQRRDQPQRRRAQNAGHGALRRQRSAQGGENGRAEGDGRRQCHQHGGKSAPDIADQPPAILPAFRCQRPRHAVPSPSRYMGRESTPTFDVTERSYGVAESGRVGQRPGPQPFGHAPGLGGAAARQMRRDAVEHLSNGADAKFAQMRLEAG